MDKAKLKSVCFIVSSAYTANAFLLNHINHLADCHDVSLIANTPDAELLRNKDIRAKVYLMPIERQIHPLKDIRALLKLYGLFREKKFDLVHSVSPKAGLLSMTAARLAGIPLRIHTFTGQVWVTRTGIFRKILKSSDYFLSRAASNILVDSYSQLDFMLGEKIVSYGEAQVLADGSICGVDLDRFKPDLQSRYEVRSKAGIPQDAMLFTYIGRLNRDKGIIDLMMAFRKTLKDHDGSHLMLVGPDEEDIRNSVTGTCATEDKSIHFIDYTDSPEKYTAAADVLCLPSFREGFGNVIIEAGAAAIPSIGSRIYGIKDAIIEGETGLMFEAGNIDELSACMECMYDDKIRTKMGSKAQIRVIEKFSQDRITAALLDYYRSVGF